VEATSATEQLDRQLASEAYKKVLAGQELTAKERAALKRHEKEKEERLRWQFYGAIPQKHWRTMSGRQTKVLNEQAARYGIPFGGAAISLPAVVRALHDFLADNALKLAKDDDELMQGSGSPALERYPPASRRWMTILRSVRRQRQENSHEEDEAPSFVSVVGGEGDFTAGRDAQRSAAFSRGDPGSIGWPPCASRGGGTAEHLAAALLPTGSASLEWPGGGARAAP
jgi:hypothetical protein